MGAAASSRARPCRRETGEHLVVESLHNDAPDIEPQVERMVCALRADGMILTPPLCDNAVVLQALAQAIALGADARAYVDWSLLDHVEWSSGDTRRFKRFRRFHVHVHDATQRRLAKDSARGHKNFIANPSHL